MPDSRVPLPAFALLALFALGTGATGENVAGDPAGVTAKSWLSSERALAFGAAHSASDSFELLTDYLWHFPHALSPEAFPRSLLVPYVGAGAVLAFNSIANTSRSSAANALGVRIPVGLEFLPHRTPIGIFAELAPGVTLAPYTQGFLQADVGIRFYP
jgi:hypothetical protein